MLLQRGCGLRNLAWSWVDGNVSERTEEFSQDTRPQPVPDSKFTLKLNKKIPVARYLVDDDASMSDSPTIFDRC